MRLAASSNSVVRVILTNTPMLTVVGPSNATSDSKLNLGYLGNGSTASNIIDMVSGSILVANSTTTTPDAINVGYVANSYGTFNLNGGTVVLTNRYTTNNAPAGETRIMIPLDPSGNGVVNLNGGTLVAPWISAVPLTNIANPGTGTLNFNGTVVTANRDNVAWITNLQNAYVMSNGAIFDTGSYNVAVAQCLQAPPSGTSGGLTKLGSGTLTLSASSPSYTAANSYTGPTTIGGGTFNVAASIYPSGSSYSALVVSNNAIVNLDLSSQAFIQSSGVTLKGSVLNLNLGESMILQLRC